MDPVTTAIAGIATKEVSKNLAKGFKDLKEFGQEGAGNIKSAMDSLTNFIGVINPFIPVIQIIASQITAGTLQSSMTTMRKLFDLVQSDTGREAIANLSKVLSGLFDLITAGVPVVSDLLAVTNTIFGVITSVIDKVQELADKMDAWMGKTFENYDEMVDKVGVSPIDAMIEPFGLWKLFSGMIKTAIDESNTSNP